MRYAKVRSPDLAVQILTRKPRPTQGVVPLNRAQVRKLCGKEGSVAKHLFYDIIYPAVYREDRRVGRPNVAYSLATPDPWLVVIAYIMWEGILQGLTWDTVKLAVQAGLRQLSAVGLAPGPDKKSHKSRTEVGFHFTSYAASGKKQYDLFVGLRRVAKGKSRRK